MPRLVTSEDVCRMNCVGEGKTKVPKNVDLGSQSLAELNKRIANAIEKNENARMASLDLAMGRRTE